MSSPVPELVMVKTEVKRLLGEMILSEAELSPTSTLSPSSAKTVPAGKISAKTKIKEKKRSQSSFLYWVVNVYTSVIS